MKLIFIGSSFVLPLLSSVALHTTCKIEASSSPVSSVSAANGPSNSSSVKSPNLFPVI